MANIKSQKKRVLTNEKARIRNVSFKSETKTLVKKVVELVNKNDKQSAYDEFIIAQKKYDVGVSKGVYNKKTASNKKSKLAKLVNSLDGKVKKTPIKVSKSKTTSKKPISKPKTASKKIKKSTNKSKPITKSKKSTLKTTAKAKK